MWPSYYEVNVFSRLGLAKDSRLVRTTNLFMWGYRTPWGWRNHPFHEGQRVSSTDVLWGLEETFEGAEVEQRIESREEKGTLVKHTVEIQWTAEMSCKEFSSSEYKAGNWRCSIPSWLYLPAIAHSVSLPQISSLEELRSSITPYPPT